MTDNQKLLQFLSSQNYMVIAVVSKDGTPWAVPVKIQRWAGKEFEWDSALKTMHSQVLKDHPEMAITIFQKKTDSQIGFYAKGKGRLVEEFKPGFGRYRFTADECWMNDETFVKRKVSLS
jgi:hypothetical protein